MKVLFICAANVGRSQIAEAFFANFTNRHSVISAGASPHFHGKKLSDIGPVVVECMKEVGIDVSNKASKQLTPEMTKEADKIVVITKTKKEHLPEYVITSGKVIYWDIEDAKDRSYEFHCRIRDEIKNLVEELVKEIEHDS
jgi:arsenate reductase